MSDEVAAAILTATIRKGPIPSFPEMPTFAGYNAAFEEEVWKTVQIYRRVLAQLKQPPTG